MNPQKASLGQLWERRKELCQIKHRASPGRRITKIERELGEIKREINKRQRDKLNQQNFQGGGNEPGATAIGT